MVVVLRKDDGWYGAFQTVCGLLPLPAFLCFCGCTGVACWGRAMVGSGRWASRRCGKEPVGDLGLLEKLSSCSFGYFPGCLGIALLVGMVKEQSLTRTPGFKYSFFIVCTIKINKFQYVFHRNWVVKYQ